MNVDQLLEKLENSPVGSRDLDFLVYSEVLNGGVPLLSDEQNNEIPYYTTSLDAALTLVPKDYDIMLGWNYHEREAGAVVGVNAMAGFSAGEAAFHSLDRSSALALTVCIAVLKSKTG